MPIVIEAVSLEKYLAWVDSNLNPGARVIINYIKNSPPFHTPSRPLLIFVLLSRFLRTVESMILLKNLF